VIDAVIAQSESQRDEIWRIREAIVDTQKREGGSIKHDVSVPVSRIPELIERGTKAILDFQPDARPMPFGHIGDGNMHFNVSQPVGMDKQDFLDTWHEMGDRLYAVVLIWAARECRTRHRPAETRYDAEVEVAGRTADDERSESALRSQWHPQSAQGAARMKFRPLLDGDIEAVVALWTDCGLTRPWNDPRKDIAFARGRPNSEVLVGERAGRILAAVMLGHDGHAALLLSGGRPRGSMAV
jgi:hypothetical protein